ncbi:MAG TPA: hypothetical protein VIW70_06355 [Rubrivivax sp.]
MASTFPPVAIPLYRPLLYRLSDQLRTLWESAFKPRTSSEVPASELYVPDLEALRHLSPRTLRDIGAPDWLQGRAADQRAAEQDRLQRWLSLPPQHDTRLW